MTLPTLHLYLAAPRGFCAGVDRAIQIVDMALEKWGPPVYVRHEIVHNKFVVDGLRRKGAIFVDELEQCPDDRPVIFQPMECQNLYLQPQPNETWCMLMPLAPWSAKFTSRQIDIIKLVYK